MVQTPSKPTTLEAFLALPETKPASEFIHERVTQKPLALGKHSCLQGQFTSVINDFAEPNKIAYAFLELQCICGTNAIVPDIAVFTQERLPIDDNGEIANVFDTAPDWMIEILSPGQRYTKVIKKIQCCLQNGTGMGWLIDPSDKAVLVHRPQQEVQIILLDEPDTVLPMPDFMNNLSYSIEDLFRLLQA